MKSGEAAAKGGEMVGCSGGAGVKGDRFRGVCVCVWKNGGVGRMRGEGGEGRGGMRVGGPTTPGTA